MLFDLTLGRLLSPQTKAAQSLRPVLSRAPPGRMKPGCRRAPTEAITPLSSGPLSSGRTLGSPACPLCPFPSSPPHGSIPGAGTPRPLPPSPAPGPGAGTGRPLGVFAATAAPSSAARPPPRRDAPLPGAPSRQRAPSLSARASPHPRPRGPPASRPGSANAGSAQPAAPGAVCQPTAKINSPKPLPSPRGSGRGRKWLSGPAPSSPSDPPAKDQIQGRRRVEPWRRRSHLPSNVHS